MKFLEIDDATVWRGEVKALRNFSLELKTGESVAILGPNGAGKSTFLKLITGEVRPQAEKRTVCRLFGDERWSLEELRHRIGMVMPEDVARFDDHEVARDAVLSSFRGGYGRTRDMRFSREERAGAETAMTAAGVLPLADRKFSALSSGEKRRFLIARALVHQPEVLVLDEPSTALDFPAAMHLLASLRGLLRENRTLVWVTHHPGEIPPEIHRVILIKEGRIFADGRKRDVLTEDVLGRLFGVDLRVGWSAGWCDVRFR